MNQRARSARYFTAWRSLQNQSAQSWYWTQVTPFVSDGDAELAFSENNPPRLMRNLRAEVDHIAVREVEGCVVRDADDQRCIEQDTTAKPELSLVKLVLGRVGRRMFAISLSGTAGHLQWPDVGEIASVQARKLKPPAT